MTELTDKEIAIASKVAQQFVRKYFCMADDPNDEKNGCELPRDHEGDCVFKVKPWER